jgi:hypothetical protein
VLRRPIESVEYASVVFEASLLASGLVASMGGRGCPHENVLIVQLSVQRHWVVGDVRLHFGCCHCWIPFSE